MPAHGNTSPKFQRSHAVTAEWEGGWSNHPADPGGKTMFGVTEATWVRFRKKMGMAIKSIRSITRQDAEHLFFVEFWQAAGCEGLADGVDLATYDASVNSGVSRGRKWLLASLDPENRNDLTVKNICRRRLSFVQALKNWKTFGRGWGRRIADIQAKGVAWALIATADAPVAAQQLEREAGDKKATSKKQGAAGVGTGTLGGGTITVEQTNHTAQAGDWLMSGIGVLLVAAAAYLLWRAFLNRQQANAYAAQAKVI